MQFFHESVIQNSNKNINGIKVKVIKYVINSLYKVVIHNVINICNIVIACWSSSHGIFWLKKAIILYTLILGC